jgi:hypothetical protein
MREEIEIYKYWPDQETRMVCNILSPSTMVNDNMNGILQDLDHDKVRNTLNRHRLFPAFYKKWKELIHNQTLTSPWLEFTEQLRIKTEANRLQMLQKTTTLLKIAEAFEKKQIPVLPLKGPVLAFQLYGDVGIKSSLDLDIFIPGGCFNSAFETLISLGLSTEFNYELSPRQKRYLLGNFHHIAFLNGHTRIELHWEINTNRFMTGHPNDEYFQKAVPLEIAGKKLQTLHPDHLIEYLAIHGSYHAWSRLDWLYDFSNALLINQKPLHTISNDMTSAGLGTIFLQSTFLAHKLFGTPSAIDFPTIPKYLILTPLKEISKPYSSAQNQKLTRFSQKWYILQLKSSLKYKLHVFSVLGTNQGNWKMLKLPDKLFFLYFILRPILYIRQIWRKHP